jgi:divalent metal cation (Fe/Co/Zn/Cd) transporter
MGKGYTLAVGFVSGSLGILGDAVDSFADAATSLWFGLDSAYPSAAQMPSFILAISELRPYTLLGAIIIAGVGLIVMYESYTKLFIVRELRYGNLAIMTALR